MLAGEGEGFSWIALLWRGSGACSGIDPVGEWAELGKIPGQEGEESHK